MTLEEKLRLFAGDLDAIDHVPGVARLGIPDINMGDGPNGVANTVPGTATSFPCNMALGDTFDRKVAGRYARAMAREFRAKGKNQILGPGANLARLPQCGRTDEYVTGDDPVVGAELIGAFVEGALEEHVMTTVKHLVNNDQETNRNQWSANPDTNVLMEYYMKPFFAAIEAGAASLMCGYNKVNWVHTCKNKDVLQAARRAGSRFWIVSDWGAVYPDAADNGAAEYVNAGLDMEMGAHDDATCQGPDVPPTKYGAGGYCNRGDYMLPDRMKRLVDTGAVSHGRVNETVSRILGAMQTAGLLDRSVQAKFPAYTYKDLHSKWYGPLAQRDVRTSFSREVAHDVARKAMVLLQNIDSTLPLSRAQKLETYGCGSEVHFHAETGSASGTQPHLPRVPCQVERAAGQTVRKTACPFPEDGLRAAGVAVSSFALAASTAGPRDLSATAIICLVASAKNSEGTDRANLDLLGWSSIPFERFKKRVVYVVAPGAVIMPFAPRVDAIVFSSLPGEMGGAALADVLLGEASPAGHLSVTMPNRMHETPVRIDRNGDSYAEGFEVGHRWYQAHNVRPAFAFGWGLSYCSLVHVGSAELRPPSGGQRPRVSLKLWCDAAHASRTTGEVDQVVQLYLQHQRPHPRGFKELAGFRKARNLEAKKQILIDVEYDPPRTWGSLPGDKKGFGMRWEPVTRYRIFLSLHGVEHAVPLFGVTAEGGGFAATPEYAFEREGPLRIDQDAVVWEAALARQQSRPRPVAKAPSPPPALVDDQRTSTAGAAGAHVRAPRAAEAAQAFELGAARASEGGRLRRCAWAVPAALGAAALGALLARGRRGRPPALAAAAEPSASERLVPPEAAGSAPP